MKKMYILLAAALCTLLLSNEVKSQEWFPVSAEWTYSCFYPSSGEPFDSQSYSITCEGDTIVDGITAKIIKGHSACYYAPVRSILYYNPVDDIVYIYLDKEFKTYFDFSKKVSENYLMHYCTNHENDINYKSLSVTVDSIVVKKVNGLELRHQYISASKAEDVIGKSCIIERIGNISMFYPEYGACDVEVTAGLRCYIDKNIQYHTNPIFEVEGCDYMFPVGIEEKQPSSSFCIYPNPFKDAIHIKGDSNDFPLNYAIYDVVGNLITSDMISHSDSLSSLTNIPKGIYFVHINSQRSTNYIYKIIKL